MTDPEISRMAASIYVQHKDSDTWVNVSVMWRRSSAAVSTPPWYYEVIVWEWKPEARERGAMLHMDGGLRRGFEIAAVFHQGGLVALKAMEYDDE